MREYKILRDTPAKVAKKLTELEKKYDVEIVESHFHLLEYPSRELDFVHLFCLVKLSSRVKITKSSIHKFKDLNPPTK